MGSGVKKRGVAVVASFFIFSGVRMRPMDFQKTWDSFSFPFPFAELPLSLRNLFSQTFRFRPLKQLGTGYYRKSATRMARAIQGSLPKMKIYLRSQDFEHSIPGVFDIDFLVLKEKEIKEKEVWELRTEYFELKRKFPVMGKVTFAQSQDFKALQSAGLSEFLGFSELQKFMDDGWKTTKAKEVSQPQDSSRLALSIYYFERAQKYLIRSFLSNSSFNRLKFLKEIGRCLFTCSGEKLGLIHSQNPSVLMAHAFYQIQQLAKLANDNSENERANFKLLFPDKNGARFAAEMVNRSWIYKLKRGDALFASLRASSTPLILLPATDLNLVSSINLFSSFINLWPSFLQDSKEIPILIPSGAFELMSLGWHWRKTHAHLGWAYPAQLEDSHWRLNCVRGTYQRLKERVLFERCLILGKVVTGSPEFVFKAMRTFCRNVLILEAKENLPDSLLIERCQSSLPNTCEVFKMLISHKNILSLQPLVKAALIILSETEAIKEK
jgi:hypothetical protein